MSSSHIIIVIIISLLRLHHPQHYRQTWKTRRNKLPATFIFCVCLLSDNGAEPPACDNIDVIRSEFCVNIVFRLMVVVILSVFVLDDVGGEDFNGTTHKACQWHLDDDDDDDDGRFT